MRVSQHLNPRKQVLFQNVLKPYILKPYIYCGRRPHFFFFGRSMVNFFKDSLSLVMWKALQAVL